MGRFLEQFSKGSAWGCSASRWQGATRYAGQVESFPINGSKRLADPASVHFNSLRAVTPQFGDPIRYKSDVITLVIEGVMLHHLPMGAIHGGERFTQHSSRRCRRNSRC